MPARRIARLASITPRAKRPATRGSPRIPENSRSATMVSTSQRQSQLHRLGGASKRNGHLPARRELHEIRDILVHLTGADIQDRSLRIPQVRIGAGEVVEGLDMTVEE